MSSYRRVRSEQCNRCNGEGQTKKMYLESLEECFDCKGYGYRVIYKNEGGYERSVEVSDHLKGHISSYFSNCSD